MRSRSNSGVRLDYHYRIIYKTILRHQNPVTGLLPATPENSDAWVRDNVYSVLAVWGLALAYKKNSDLDEDRVKSFELEQSCVKLMRGLLMAMLQQKDKVERFKESQSPKDALHAKYSSTLCQTVVKDNEWGHLQIDATSLYLLILAQMTASGLQIIFNLDEVAFVQNLIFYIESAYCIPDYGIWERGDKTNSGLPELNASSIGMAKAALEAMNELDLFGARGGPSSVIHVLADEAQKCEAVLQSMLPRESNSKEVDAGLLSVISFPAFAVTDPNLIAYTRQTIVDKLQGRYGCKRFLRDGYKTCKEDPNRLYYEPWELRIFENIECEWPIFFCYLILDACFQGDKEMLSEYEEALEEILVTSEDGLRLVPELYSVPNDKVNAEYKEPHSQERIPLGRCPFMWAQSLYTLGQLLREGFLAPGELDPLNRRLGSEKKPDVVVQIVILAADESIQEKLRNYDVDVQTIAEVSPVEVQPAKVLSNIFTYLGRNKKLSLTGRKSRDVGILSTSKIYSLQDRIFAFTPQFADLQRFYIASDIDLLLDNFKTEIAFLKSNWHMLGRPTVVIPIIQALLDEGRIPPAMLSTLKKLRSGYINGTRVNLGRLTDFMTTSCITSLNFLNNHEEGYPDSLNVHVQEYLEKELNKPLVTSKRRMSIQQTSAGLATMMARRKARYSRRTSVAGLIRRSRSFKVHDDDNMMGGKRAGSPGMTLPPLIDVPASPSFESPSSSDAGRTRSPSPGRISEPGDDDWAPIIPSRTQVDAQFELIDIEELISTLRETDSLEEQGDILHYLAVTNGVDWKICIEDGNALTVRELLKELYDKACHDRNWALVRHTSGMLGKRVEDLAKALTDLLVRQKQVTIGMPPYQERTITGPLPSGELRNIIHHAYGSDESTSMLTQELIVYLAMFIRTEPHLFYEMLRIRVGLIIQVMASELARTLKCAGKDASEYLLNLSPFEMKNLLHHLLSGKEFGVQSGFSGGGELLSRSDRISRIHHVQDEDIGFQIVKEELKRATKKSHVGSTFTKESLLDDSFESERLGQWLRRRKLDGALNRVPKGFYPKIWHLLERCHGVSIAGKVVPQSLTQEMTPGELKFALQVETVLNAIPQPEYRQLIVEALMVLTLAVEHDVVPSLGHIVHVELVVHKANEIFLADQKSVSGDATLCCAALPTTTKDNACNGAAGICQHFYDSAPSGCYGTMTYMIRAAASTLDALPQTGEIDCNVS